MNRKTFLKSALGCAAGCMLLSPGSNLLADEQKAARTGPVGEPDPGAVDAARIRKWLSQFLEREEDQLDRKALVKLMEERGRACCRALDFRQKLIKDSAGSTEKLIELMGKIVGPENCRREGDKVILIYPTDKCVCGWSPKRAPKADDPYCDCSKANNQSLCQIVTGKPVQVEVTESPRRGGSRCRFVIHLA